MRSWSCCPNPALGSLVRGSSHGSRCILSVPACGLCWSPRDGLSVSHSLIACETKISG